MRDVSGRLMALGALATLALACGSSSNSEVKQDGSASGAGGMQTTGGGGATGNGGSTGAGGATGSGGATGNGGTTGTGGATGAGGMIGAGGTTGAGGSSGTCAARTSYTQGDHMILTVNWNGGLATMGGTAQQVHIWTKVVWTANGNNLSGMAQACGTVLPPTGLTAIAGGGMILIEIPDASWDAPSMPKFAITGTHTGWNVGSTYTFSANSLIGFTTDPGATWPTSYTGISGVVDAETDMNAGLSAIPRTSAGYVAPPTSILQTNRVDKVYIVLRNTQSGMLTRSACDAASGTVTFTHFDNHVVGCHVMGGSDCMPTDTNFVDQNRTVYTVTSATIQSKIVPDNSTCAAIRSALPM